MLDAIAQHFLNRTRVRIMPVSGDLPGNLVDYRQSAMEDRCAAANFAVAFMPELLGYQWSKPFLPFPYGLMGELKSSEKKHLGRDRGLTDN
jgi:hypothetical protein